MEGTFVLKIELGNDAMRTPRNLADALVLVAVKLKHVKGITQGNILDINGNSVGSWEVQ